jgi:ATP-dependent DNA ligase
MPYGTRRTILETCVKPLHSRAMLAARTPILMNGVGGMKNAEQKLVEIFASAIADHQEGIVIKAEASRYSDRRYPWVKVMLSVINWTQLLIYLQFSLRKITFAAMVIHLIWLL